VDRDITLFLKTYLSEFAASIGGFSRVLSWPAENDVATLVKKSGGLFIYTETILKLVTADNSPMDRLRLIISMPDSTTDEGSSGLDGLYNQIIEDGYTKGVSDSFFEQLRLILATIVLVFNPLSRSSLATLLDVGSRTILASLRSLHSLILVPDNNSDPIRPFHKSFPDYVTDQSRCKDAKYYINPGVYHAKIVIRCLELMDLRLKKNICNLPKYAMNEDVTDLPTRRMQYIGDAVDYSCRFWGKHLMLASGADEGDVAQILVLLNNFFRRHLLTWLEVLSIGNDLSRAIHSLLDAEQWVINVSSSTC